MTISCPRTSTSPEWRLNRLATSPRSLSRACGSRTFGGCRTAHLSWSGISPSSSVPIIRASRGSLGHSRLPWELSDRPVTTSPLPAPKPAPSTSSSPRLAILENPTSSTPESGAGFEMSSPSGLTPYTSASPGELLCGPPRRVGVRFRCGPFSSSTPLQSSGSPTRQTGCQRAINETLSQPTWSRQPEISLTK